MELKYVKEDTVYISDDSMDCFYFYCTRLNEAGPSGIKVSFWIDGLITMNQNVYYTDRFEEEEPYVESSKRDLIKECFKDAQSGYED